MTLKDSFLNSQQKCYQIEIYVRNCLPNSFHIEKKLFQIFLQPSLIIMMIIWFKKSSHTRITIDIFWNASWNNRGAEIGELGVLSFRFTRKFLQKQFLCGTKYSLPAFLILQFLLSTFWIMLSLKRLNNGIVLFKWYGNLRL